MKKADIQKLGESLREFGLNPAEWALSVRRGFGGIFQIEVRSIRERGLILNGWADRRAWLDLSFHG